MHNRRRPLHHIKSFTFGSKNCRTTPPTVIMIAMYSPTIPTLDESKNPIMWNSAATKASLQNPLHAYSSAPDRSRRGFANGRIPKCSAVKPHPK